MAESSNYCCITELAREHCMIWVYKDDEVCHCQNSVCLLTLTQILPYQMHSLVDSESKVCMCTYPQ